MSNNKTKQNKTKTKHRKFENDHKSKLAFAQLFRELFTEMKPKHFQLLRKVLSDIDKSGTGKIMFIELKSGMISFIKSNKDLIQANLKVDRLFSGYLLQIDDNSEIIYDDLINVATNDYIIDRDENLYSTLRELDQDDDGLISTKELIAHFGEIETYGRVKDIEKIIEESNLDENGKIDYELFLKTLHPSYDNKPKWFHLGLNADKDKDKDNDNKENDSKENKENKENSEEKNNNNKSNNSDEKPNVKTTKNKNKIKRINSNCKNEDSKSDSGNNNGNNNSNSTYNQNGTSKMNDKNEMNGSIHNNNNNNNKNNSNQIPNGKGKNHDTDNDDVSKTNGLKSKSTDTDTDNENSEKKPPS